MARPSPTSTSGMMTIRARIGRQPSIAPRLEHGPDVQVIVRKDRPKGMSAAAQLSVTARRQGGHWRIVDMHAR